MISNMRSLFFFLFFFSPHHMAYVHNSPIPFFKKVIAARGGQFRSQVLKWFFFFFLMYVCSADRSQKGERKRKTAD